MTAAASIPVEVSMCSRVADARVVLALSALVATGACQTDLNDEGPVVGTEPPPPLNRPPVLGRPTVTVSPNTRATLDLLAGASDPDGDALTVTHVALDSIGAVGASVQLRGDQRTVDVTPPINFAGLIFISYFVSDGHGSVSGQASVVLDNAPRALDAQQDVLENNATLVNLKGADANSDPLTFKIETQPKHGTLSGFPPTLLYTPASGFVGDDSFTFSVSDGHLSSPAGTISLHVAPPNRRPSATPQSVTVLEDTTAAITLSGTDPDSDPLSFQILTSPARGTLSVNGASVTYQPAANYNGPDSFTFVVMDPHLSTSDPATVSITVGPVNDPPVALGLARSLNEDTPLSLTLQATDADGDSPTFAIQDPPQHGSVTGTPPSVTYTPAANYNGPDSFTFTASDANSTSAPATVSLTVAAVNDAPVAVDGAVTTAEDTRVAITLQATDVDSPALTFSIVSRPSDGSLACNGANCTYTPAPNANGTRSFTFTAFDGARTSATATITITITPVNDPPVAVDDWVATDAGAALTIRPLANDSDVDGDAISIASAGTPAHGGVDIVDAQLVYTPDADFTGVDTFSYTIADPSGATATATVHVGVGQFPQGAPTETIAAINVILGASFNAASLSGDGRYVVFTTAVALVPDDTNGTSDVYVYDRGTRTMSRVSVATGGGQSNSDSFNPRISPDGRYVVFESPASNLVPDDTNQVSDVFRHDRLTGTTVRVSVTTGGGQAGGASFDARMSDDGNVIVFTSSAFDLVAGDANGAADIFVHDMAAGTTTRVSVSAIGADADLASHEPDISGDGRFVAFSSAATNLVAGDTNGVTDIFVRDLVAGTTSRVNVSSTGGQADRASTGPSLSNDGQFVSFLSSATTLVTGAPSATQVYVRDTHALTTTRPLLSSFSLAWARLSGDGRYLAAYSSSTGVTICDRFKPATATPSGSGSWVWPIFSGNGRYVAVLTSPGSNLVVAPNPL
jgi:Big-like domain-containing protein/WD40 repeat protein